MPGQLHNASRTGTPAYWRSLDELADNAEFRRWLAQEFPGGLDGLDGVF
jgi:MoCo/4Fe-4S cofactor protein with predicted Tat translocation signal